jgi:hypothetical protein
MARVWILRSLRSAGYEQLAFGDGLIAIGWGAVGDLSFLATEPQIRGAVRAAFPFVGQESVRSYAKQLFLFYTIMDRGDLVVLLRRSSPDVAVGWIAGEYRYRDHLESEVRHMRPVLWKRIDLSRASVAWLLLNMPTLTMIYHVEEQDSFEKLVDLAESDVPFGGTDPVSSGGEIQELSTPFTNLKRNLNYARNLATAGHHLTQLQVGAFEVPDVFRAAWVQGVAALDYWVRQEVRARMLWLAQRPGEPRPRKFVSFEIPLGEIENILQSRSSLADVIDELEEGIDVTGCPARVVRKGHRSTAEHVEVCHHAAPGKPVAKTAERLLDARAVEQRRGIAHAASIS